MFVKFLSQNNIATSILYIALTRPLVVRKFSRESGGEKNVIVFFLGAFATKGYKKRLLPLSLSVCWHVTNHFFFFAGYIFIK
jgi:hypothetical protein